MRYYVLIRLKDNRHVEAEFNTSEEVREFLDQYKENLVPYETVIEDRFKIREKADLELWGKIAMWALGLLTLYLAFK